MVSVAPRFTSQEAALTLSDSDYNFAPDPNSGKCIPTGPEVVPPEQCKSDKDTFMGSSGYRKIPGDTCRVKGSAKDEKKRKSCSEASAAPGQISHQTVCSMQHLDWWTTS